MHDIIPHHGECVPQPKGRGMGGQIPGSRTCSIISQDRRTRYNYIRRKLPPRSPFPSHRSLLLLPRERDLDLESEYDREEERPRFEDRLSRSSLSRSSRSCGVQHRGANKTMGKNSVKKILSTYTSIIYR